MACNCKRAAELVDGTTDIEEGVLMKAWKVIYKILLMLLVICLAVVMVPIIVLYAIWQMIFGKGGIHIPNKVFKLAGLNG